MGTTSNFGFPFPEDTDLVRDGAQAIEDLADAVDGVVANGFRFVGQVTFTADGTFLRDDPLGTGDIKLRAVRVRVVGGGGGGGRGRSGRVAAGGGGGGTAVTLITDISSLPGSVGVTVGGSGAGATTDDSNGAAGTDSMFGSLCVATGGRGTLNSGLQAVRPSTAGTIGDFFAAGGPGGSGSAVSGSAGGVGGSSTLGGGGQGQRGNVDGPGGDGQVFGGGGGGGVGPANGGDGAVGIVIVELYA